MIWSSRVAVSVLHNAVTKNNLRNFGDVFDELYSAKPKSLTTLVVKLLASHGHASRAHCAKVADLIGRLIHLSSCSAHVCTRTFRDARSLCHTTEAPQSASEHMALGCFRVLITDRLNATVCNLVQAPNTPIQSSRTGDRPTDKTAQADPQTNFVKEHIFGVKDGAQDHPVAG